MGFGSPIHGKCDREGTRGVVFYRLRAGFGDERANRRACGSNFQDDRTNSARSPTTHRNWQIESLVTSSLCRESAANGQREAAEIVLRNAIGRGRIAPICATGV